jgi:hypothetical protein
MPILLPNGEGEDLNGSTCADTERKKTDQQPSRSNLAG